MEYKIKCLSGEPARTVIETLLNEGWHILRVDAMPQNAQVYPVLVYVLQREKKKE